MEEKKLSIIILGKDNKKLDYSNYEITMTDASGLLRSVAATNGKYVVFSKDGDNVNKDYLDTILKKCDEDFDCCFINYTVACDYKKNTKVLTNINELKKYKPFKGEYIWSFIFKREKLLEILSKRNSNDFDFFVDEIFTKTTAIGKILYTHNPNNEAILKDFCYNDVKPIEYYKNIIYMGSGCNGVFNGYISWLNNLYRCFPDKYDITIIYTEMYKPTLDMFSKKFRCVKHRKDVNYVCDRMMATYSTYFYPKNIITLDENYMFIHGNMSDYDNAMHFYDDIYTKYIAVSKVAAEKAVGYFPSNNIEYLYNPFKLDKSLVKPHLKLVSAQRHSEVKKPERINIVANILDELEIPYTWNVFTDKNENTNINGVIYRKRVYNPLPYMADADYFVILSNSEALPYCVVEALSVNTKILCTPLEAMVELGVKDGENGFFIPFDYFEPKNKNKLVKLIKKVYKEKEKEFSYRYSSSMYSGYNDLFIK